jgi:hypothetical protein
MEVSSREIFDSREVLSDGHEFRLALGVAFLACIGYTLESWLGQNDF